MACIRRERCPTRTRRGSSSGTRRARRTPHGRPRSSRSSPSPSISPRASRWTSCSSRPARGSTRSQPPAAPTRCSGSSRTSGATRAISRGRRRQRREPQRNHHVPAHQRRHVSHTPALVLPGRNRHDGSHGVVSGETGAIATGRRALPTREAAGIPCPRNDACTSCLRTPGCADVDGERTARPACARFRAKHRAQSSRASNRGCAFARPRIGRVGGAQCKIPPSSTAFVVIVRRGELRSGTLTSRPALRSGYRATRRAFFGDVRT